MARIQLDSVASKVYQAELRGEVTHRLSELAPVAAEDQKVSPLRARRPAPSAVGKRRGQSDSKNGAVQRSSADTCSPSSTPGQLMRSSNGETAAMSHVREDADAAHDLASAQPQPAGSLNGMQAQTRDASSSDATSTDDMEGLPTASMQDARKAARKAHAQSGNAAKGQPITQEGAHADKLGLAFERVLAKAPQRGIMEGNKAVKKRQREEEDAAAAAKELRKARRARRKLGRIKVERKGRDPDRDAREKELARIATKGVVQLFNAITQAQKAKTQAEAAGSKSAVKETKAALFDALQPRQDAEAAHKDAEVQPGWNVLRSDSIVPTGGTKMKDLDRAATEDAGADDALQDLEPSDEDYADW